MKTIFRGSEHKTDLTGLKVMLWLSAGILAAPIATLLHELGHYALGRAFGFQNLVLHYSAVSFKSFVELPSWQLALEEIAGPVVSFIILLLAMVWIRKRQGLHPFALTLGAEAAIRFSVPPLMALVLVFRVLFRIRTPYHGNIDEYNFALTMGWPPMLVLLLATLCTAPCIYWLLRTWRSQSRLLSGILLAGMIIGWILYYGLAGPRLLP